MQKQRLAVRLGRKQHGEGFLRRLDGMDVKPQVPLGDVLVVLLRDDERPDARLLRAVRLFKDAADGAHASGERDLAR